MNKSTNSTRDDRTQKLQIIPAVNVSALTSTKTVRLHIFSVGRILMICVAGELRVDALLNAQAH